MPTIEEALAALDAELARPQRRKLPAAGPGYETKTWVDWKAVASWLYEHPEQPFEADPVHAQAIYRFRKNHPEITVVGSRHRLEEGTGRRVGKLWACYEPAETSLTEVHRIDR